MKAAKTWAKEFLAVAPAVSCGTVEVFAQNVQADARIDLFEDIEDLAREIGRLETLLKARQAALLVLAREKGILKR